MQSKNKKSILFILIFSLIISPLFCQVKLSENNRFFSEYVISNWTADNGLPGNTVLDLIQRKNGYVYFGTYDCLIRFDGKNFFKINRSLDSKYDFVSARSLYEDVDGNLWIGSNDEGLICVFSDGSVKKWNKENGLPNNSIRSICQDQQKNIWVGTSMGVVYIDTHYQVNYPILSSSPTVDNNSIVTQVYCDTAGRIWVVTLNGLYIYDNDILKYYDRLKIVNNILVSSVTQDYNGNFWFGVAPCYALYVEDGKETLYDLSYDNKVGTEVKSIHQDQKGNVWFARDVGVSVISNNTISHLDSSNGLPNEMCYSITEDSEGNIWVSTDRSGLIKLSQTKFKSTILDTSVNAIAEDNFRDCMWIATDKGLYCYKDNSFIETPLTDFCKGIRIRHVEITYDNELLISTYEKFGQIIFDKDNNITSYTKENGYLLGNKCRVAIKSSKGDIYVGTTSGLSIIEKDGKTVHFINKDSLIENSYIMCLYEDKNGVVWVGTDGGGIFRIKNYQVIDIINTQNGLAGNVVYKIGTLVGDDIWITTGRGLSCYKDGSFFNYDSSCGLSTDSIHQVLIDYTSKVWITSNRGIYSVKYKDLVDYREGNIDKVITKFYGASDGIICSGATSTAMSIVDNMGRIWFTMLDGFTMYDPLKALQTKNIPLVKLENVVIDSNRFEYDGNDLILDVDDKRITLEYAGLSYTSPDQIMYSVMLEGFDTDYSQWTYTNNVSYTNLKPGTYRFYIRILNGEDLIGYLQKPVTIIKRPAYYQTVYFWLLIIISVLVITAGLVSTKIRRTKKYQRTLEKDVQIRTSQLLALQRDLENQVNDRTEQIRKMTLEITESLARTIDAKDSYTKGHSGRVAYYSKLLAEALGKTKIEIDEIYIAATLHDIGKIGIPDNIINKESKLTQEERIIIEQHPVIGAEILKDVYTIPEIAIVAKYHHERWDGKGYPDGLKGEQIPVFARIVCVADSYDAMTSNRSYRNYMTQAEARKEIFNGIGTQFDPEIATQMLKLIDNDIDYLMHE